MKAESELLPCPFCGGPVRWGSEEKPDLLNVCYCEACSIEFTFLWHGNSPKYAKAFNQRNLLEQAREWCGGEDEADRPRRERWAEELLQHLEHLCGQSGGEE